MEESPHPASFLLLREAGKVARRAGWMAPCKFAAALAQGVQRRGGGPHPIRPSATFLSDAGEGNRAAIRGLG